MGWERKWLSGMRCSESMKRRVRTGDGAGKGNKVHEGRKERSKGKGRKSEKKGESDRPCKWKGMGSHSPSLALLANFSHFW